MVFILENIVKNAFARRNVFFFVSEDKMISDYIKNSLCETLKPKHVDEKIVMGLSLLEIGNLFHEDLFDEVKQCDTLLIVNTFSFSGTLDLLYENVCKIITMHIARWVLVIFECSSKVNILPCNGVNINLLSNKDLASIKYIFIKKLFETMKDPYHDLDLKMVDDSMLKYAAWQPSITKETINIIIESVLQEKSIECKPAIHTILESKQSLAEKFVSIFENKQDIVSCIFCVLRAYAYNIHNSSLKEIVAVVSACCESFHSRLKKETSIYNVLT